MNRRRFVEAGVSSLFIARTMIPASADSPGRAVPAWDYLFFDERFAEARRLAVNLAGKTEPIPVQGDITPVWIGGLSRASLAASLTLQGVTIESFYFCLKVLLVEQVGVDAQVRRLDRDLHLWTIHTDNHHMNGKVSWQNLSRPA